MIDEIDAQILRLLCQDGRMTNAALAEAVGLTPTPMLQRLRKLESRGVIAGYQAVLDPVAVERATQAFVQIRLAEHNEETHRRFLRLVGAMPEVLEMHHVAGDMDFILRVAVKDIAAYERFLLEGLKHVPGIARVNSTFILSTGKDVGVAPL